MSSVTGKIQNVPFICPRGQQSPWNALVDAGFLYDKAATLSNMINGTPVFISISVNCYPKHFIFSLLCIFIGINIELNSYLQVSFWP
jgi:hypothetical protein